MSVQLERYVYQDERGDDQYRVVRRGAKEFHIESFDSGSWHKGLNGKPLLLYRLPEVIKGINSGQVLYIVEGERDVNTAFANELVATCNHGGAGKWRKEHSRFLLNARNIIIVWDRDDAGKKHALDISHSLRQIGFDGTIKFQRAKAGKDLTDHFAEGFEEFELVDQRPRLKESARASEAVETEYLPGAFQLVLAKLEKLGPVVSEFGKENQFNGVCPAHDDHRPSLSVSLGNRRQVILKCHAGCDYGKIVAALGINRRELSQGDPESTHEVAVDKRVEMLRIHEEAKFRHHIEKARNLVMVEPEFRVTGADELELPDLEEKWLFADWFPAESMVLLNADRKTGKTRLCLSLAKSVCDREPFLGRFETTAPEDAKVMYLNYEMPAAKFRSWLRESEFAHPENLLPMNLKGRTLPFNDLEVMRRLAAYIRRERVCLIIFDTQIKVMVDLGCNENDNADVAAFHMAIEQLMDVSECHNVLLAHHIGKADKERGRGASRIEDGVDVIWTLVRESGDELSGRVPRSLAGEGRDVLREPIELVYEDVTGLYHYEGVSVARKARIDKLDAVIARILEWHSEVGRWPTMGEIRRMGLGKTSTVSELLEEGRSRGLLRRTHYPSDHANTVRYKVIEPEDLNAS
jgi:hypothetical protein